jgi:hypothetical protein
MSRRILILVFVALIALGVFFSSVAPVHAEGGLPVQKSLVICRTCN